ncbi:phosphoglycerate-specific signal transduction histidine kinase, partial [Janthinobacterium sp. CG_23.3]
MRISFPRTLLPRSLRVQFTLALSALAMLVVGGGAIAVYALRSSSDATRELADQRLVRMQGAQDVLQQSMLIDRDSDRLLVAASPEALRASYDDMVRQLAALDAQVAALAQASDDVAVLDLQQASQAFRNTANIVASLHEGVFEVETAFARGVRERGAQLQAGATRPDLERALLLQQLRDAADAGRVRQLALA